MGTDDYWQYVVGFGALPALIYLVLTRFFPESPKYQYLHLGDREAAIKGIRYFQGEQADVESIIREYEHERSLASTGGNTASISEILSTRHMRIPFFLSILIELSQNAGGMDSVTNYSTETLTKLGLNEFGAQIATIVTSAIPLPVAIFALFAVEKYGRRPLLIVGISLGLAGKPLFGPSCSAGTTKCRFEFSAS